MNLASNKSLKHKRNEQFSNNKNKNIKLSVCVDSIQSCLGARKVHYALRCLACMVSGVNSLINKCFNMNWLPYDAKYRKILLLLFKWTNRSLESQRSLFTYTYVYRL